MILKNLFSQTVYPKFDAQVYSDRKFQYEFSLFLFTFCIGVQSGMIIQLFRYLIILSDTSNTSIYKLIFDFLKFWYQDN